MREARERKDGAPQTSYWRQITILDFGHSMLHPMEDVHLKEGMRCPKV
jgi:hypothetical protein